MNYQAYYDRLISRARGRSLTGLKERHHVVPRCLGGADSEDNLVDLTPEEHYVAHQLLTKLNPTIGPLAYAVVLMAPGCTGNKAYGWLRKRLAGIPKSSEHRQKIGSGNKGKVRSPEVRQRIAASLKGRKIPREIVDKIAAKTRGKKRPPFSAEWRAKLSSSQKGRPRGELSEQHRARMSASLRGNKRNLGKKHSPETIAKQAVARRAYWASKKLLKGQMALEI